MLFENENSKLIDGAVATARLAIKSILRLLLLTWARCSLGRLGGASGGRADENDHSSSSFAAAGTDTGGWGDRALRAAKGSCAAGFEGGGEKGGRFETGG